MDAETMWFVEAVTKYLREMASRGDQQAAQLFEEAVALLEGDEEEETDWSIYSMENDQ